MSERLCIRKALSLRQPWASMIIDGPKRIENRFKRTSWRGWILLHASTFWCEKYNSGVYQFCRKNGLLEMTRANPDGSCTEIVRELLQRVPVQGGIIGAMHITDCVDESDDPFWMGPHGYVIDQVIKLPFYPCKGSLGFFNVSVPQEISDLAPGAAYRIEWQGKDKP